MHLRKYFTVLLFLLLRLITGDGRFSFEEFIQFMENMGGITENKDGEDEEELRQAFKASIKSIIISY